MAAHVLLLLLLLAMCLVRNDLIVIHLMSHKHGATLCTVTMQGRAGHTGSGESHRGWVVYTAPHPTHPHNRA